MDDPNRIPKPRVCSQIPKYFAVVRSHKVHPGTSGLELAAILRARAWPSKIFQLLRACVVLYFRPHWLVKQVGIELPMSLPVKKLFVTLHRSFAGSKGTHVQTAKALGLSRLQQETALPNSPSVRGAIDKVSPGNNCAACAIGPPPPLRLLLAADQAPGSSGDRSRKGGKNRR